MSKGELYQGIPVLYATMDDLEFTDGYNTVAIVQNPATQKETFLFSDQKKRPHKFAVVSEERRLMMGVMMVADTKIIRVDPETGDEFWMVFPASVVERMSFKAMKDQRTKNVNIEHRSDLAVDQVYIVESWVFDSSRGYKLPKFLKGTPEGSWIVTLKFDNEELWEWVKNSGVSGLSLEGNFGLSLKMSDEQLENSELWSKLYKSGNVNSQYNVLLELVNNGK